MPARIAADPEANQLELGQHFWELKRRLVIIVLVFIPVTVLGLAYAKPVMSLLLTNAPPTYFFAPSEAFASHLRVAVLLGLTATWPVILMQIYLFAAPGLYPVERRALIWILPSGLILFAAGLLFGYLVAMPALRLWLGRFTAEGIRAAVSISLYVAFMVRILLASAFAWQLPLISVILTSLGLVTATTLVTKRRWVILGIVVGSALLTPPDPVSQLLIAAPIILLYEISIVLARLVERRAARQAG